ncbi:CotH kinase family protein [Rubripirellula amarantea]|nr:CotH kinase family protein [Rubripirellula amarantea]
MPKSQSFFARTLSRIGRSQQRSRLNRRRPSRRLRTEALEARQLLAGDLFINELMADNDATIEDPDEAGAFEDWVEIYNAGTEAVDLGGMYLTDDVEAPTQWQFPAGSTVAAGGYLLIWADDESDQGDDHASFKLSSGGEIVALYDSDGTTLVDSLEFGEQATDVSFGRSPDGSETLSVLTTATPGAANSAIAESNLAPIANAGGPYTGTNAETILLSGLSSFDSDGEIATYAWDLDHDGQYDDAVGETVNFSSATVGTFVVGLQVTDDDGAINVDTAAIKVTQVGDEVSPWDSVTIDDEAAAFFDDTYVHEVYITFDDADWYDTLYTSHATDVEDPYFLADFVADGVALDSVGVRFKGNSSFEGTGVKKSIKIDFNEFEDLTFMGLKKLNLNNNFNDPTMLREKLFYDYASNFVEGVSRAVHTKVYINGEYYGLYTAVEQVDSTFTESRFGEDEDGNLYKGTASDDAVLEDPNADFGSDLTYLGTDQSEYEAFYELKTNEAANDYSDLIEFIDVLNNTSSGELADAIEPLLDVDNTLTSLALNNLFANLDSYSGAAHNYYLYDRDDTGQFTHVFWDVNESFGTFTQFVDRGQVITDLDPFWLPVATTMGPPGTATESESRPLAENLWAVDEYSTEYLRDLAEMLREGFDVESVTARINELADLIRADVTADPNKQFTTAQFEQNLTTNVTSGNRTIYGLSSFISSRSTYLSSVLDSYASQSDLALNELMSVNVQTVQDEAGDFDPWVEIYNNGPGTVSLAGLYLTDTTAELSKWAIPTDSLSDGDYLTLWLDGEVSEGSNHANFELETSGGELYLTDGTSVIDTVTYAALEGDSSFARVPDGVGELEVTNRPTPGSENAASAVSVESVVVYINELMADNDTTIEDPDEVGAFEDWVELYNPGTSAVDLSGFYLTDDAAEPTQWAFPSGSTIEAGGYLVIWADGDTDQGDDHASFKLSASGESVLLYNVDGTTLVDSVTFGEQSTDVSYGRFPNGSSTFLELSAATPGAANTNDVITTNSEPTADAGGPYTGTVGDSVSLTGAASVDSDGMISSYAWDLDNDGDYDDATGVTASFDASVAGTFIVGLQVTDDGGATDTATATITVESSSTPGLVLTQSDEMTVVNESGLTDSVSASLSSQPASDVTVTITSANSEEVLVDLGQLVFTPDNWDVVQTVVFSSADDGVIDGSQTTIVTFSVSSDDVDYATLADTEVSVVSHDLVTAIPPTRIYTPDYVVRPHVIVGDSIPTAILFQAVADAEISVVSVGTVTVGQSIRIVNESVEPIDFFDEGVSTAVVTAGQFYAIIFEAHTETQTYSVESTAGTDAFTPSSPRNFLQPTDTNGDSVTSALDALIVINQLSRIQTGEGEVTENLFMYDVSGDGNTTALDALQVVNEISRQNAEASEGERSPVSDAVVAPLNETLIETVSAPLSAPLSSDQDDEDDFTSDFFDLSTIEEQATLELVAFDSQAQAVAEFAYECDADVSEEDFDLLAEDLHQALASAGQLDASFNAS